MHLSLRVYRIVRLETTRSEFVCIIHGQEYFIKVTRSSKTSSISLAFRLSSGTKNSFSQ